jgi:hypothetical protein
MNPRYGVDTGDDGLERLPHLGVFGPSGLNAD